MISMFCSAAAIEEGNKQPRKSLGGPLIAIAASVAGWFYGMSQNVLDTFKAIYNGTYGESATLGADSSFSAGAAATSNDNLTMLIIAGVVALVTIIGVIGVIAFFKRLFKR